MRTPILLAAAAPRAAAAIPSGAHAAKTSTVKFGEYFYTPKKLTIRAGDRVRFVNAGKIEHTVADSTKGGTIRSKVIKPRPLAHGASQTVTFARRGTIYYLCTFHPSLMRGTIVVRSS
jgi:plastocyanin